MNIQGKIRSLVSGDELSERQIGNGAYSGALALALFASASAALFAIFAWLCSRGLLPNTLLGNPNAHLDPLKTALFLALIWLFLQIVFCAPPRWKKTAVLLSALCTLPVLLPVWVIGVLAVYGFVLYFVVHSNWPSPFKWTILLIIWAGMYFGYLGWLEPLLEKRSMEGFAIVLFFSYFLKDVYYLFEKTTVYKRREDKHSLRDFYIFFMSSPFFFNVYHIKPIGYTYFHEKFLDRPYSKIVMDGVWLFGLGVGYLLLNAHVFTLWYEWPNLGSPPYITDFYTTIPGWQILFFIYYNFLKVFLILAGNVYLIVGLMRMFGFDIKADFHYPFFARNLLEHWRRWNIYNRDFVVALIFNPFVFTIGRKMNKYLAYFIASMLTFVGGLGILVHLITTTFYVGSPRFMIGILSRTILLGLATSFNIWIQLWMAKKKRSKRLEQWYANHRVIGTVRHGLKIVGTFTLVGSIYFMQQALTAGLTMADVGRMLLEIVL
jgi:D-alanyl-lipoteichoic acid acyltransferase DltB (MBOAT superfamily)